MSQHAQPPPIGEFLLDIAERFGLTQGVAAKVQQLRPGVVGDGIPAKTNEGSPRPWRLPRGGSSAVRRCHRPCHARRRCATGLESSAKMQRLVSMLPTATRSKCRRCPQFSQYQRASNSDGPRPFDHDPAAGRAANAALRRRKTSHPGGIRKRPSWRSRYVPLDLEEELFAGVVLIVTCSGSANRHDDDPLSSKYLFNRRQAVPVLIVHRLIEGVSLSCGHYSGDELHCIRHGQAVLEAMRTLAHRGCWVLFALPLRAAIRGKPLPGDLEGAASRFSYLGKPRYSCRGCDRSFAALGSGCAP